MGRLRYRGILFEEEGDRVIVDHPGGVGRMATWDGWKYVVTEIVWGSKKSPLPTREVGVTTDPDRAVEYLTGDEVFARREGGGRGRGFSGERRIKPEGGFNGGTRGVDRFR